MLNASDALSAHAHCKMRIAEMLDANAARDPFYCELAPDQKCPVVRFIRENGANPMLEPEVTQARIAHASMHCAVIDLAQKRHAGERIDIAAAFGSNGPLGAASSALVDSLYRLERKIHLPNG